jgi:chitinase
MNPRTISCLSIVTLALTLTSSASAQSRRFVGYFTEWGVYDNQFYPADIPAAKLTHLNYAFVQPVDGADLDSYYECTIADTWAARNKTMQRTVPGTLPGEEKGTLNQLRRLRTWRQQNNQTLPILLSIGAYSMRARFSALAADPAHRLSFVNSCVTMMQQEQLDGIDLDWEFPTSSETDNYTAILQDFRNALNALGTNPRTNAPYLLTAAVAGAKSNIDAINVAAVKDLVDWVNVMTYDYHGCWGNSHTGHNSPLRLSSQDTHTTYSTDYAVREWLRRGMPAGKIHLGLAYYGRALNNLQNAGPNPSFPGRYATLDPALNNDPNCVVGTFGSDDGAFDYWDLADRFVNLNGYTRYWDWEQEVPFLYKDQAGYWITYDDANSVSTKVHYARNMSLGGIFVWELALESRPAAPKTYPLTDAAAGCLND